MGGRLNVQGFPPSVPPPEYEINANPFFCFQVIQWAMFI
ncbi:hypothetical protein BN440_0080 [Erwinia amylovora MR1]|nr:hypothetical protein BN440_0080 [Erwinia amylovora MR1]